MIVNPNYSFLEADYSNPSLGKPVKTDVIKGKMSKLKHLLNSSNLTASASASTLMLTPTIAFASDNTFGNVYDAVMNLFDSAVVLIIIFAGASWMLGHRSKAIELLIGAGCGYLIARHAIDIRDFLKAI